jgi:membrane-associated phospholipid phosphatase
VKLARHRDDWLLLLLAAACVVMAYVFVQVGSDVLEGELTGLDRAVRDFVIAHRSPGAITFFGVVSWLGAKSVLVVLSIVVAWRLSGHKGVIVLVALCALASAEFVDLLKAGFGVARPPYGLVARRSFSFPSGHVSGTSAMATLLCYVAVRQRVAVWPVITGSVLVVVLVAISRVYLDVHWTSDVLGGVLIGVMLGLAFCAVYELMRRRQVGPTAPTDPVQVR